MDHDISYQKAIIIISEITNVYFMPIINRACFICLGTGFTGSFWAMKG